MQTQSNIADGTPRPAPAEAHSSRSHTARADALLERLDAHLTTLPAEQHQRFLENLLENFEGRYARFSRGQDRPSDLHAADYLLAITGIGARIAKLRDGGGNG